jgi:hypothetical protein
MTMRIAQCESMKCSVQCCCKVEGIMAFVQCPVCLGNAEVVCCEEFPPTGDADKLDCDRCGRYRLAGSLRESELFLKANQVWRASLSHFLKRSQGEDWPIASGPRISALGNAFKLPSPIEQSARLIQMIGGHYERTGAAMPLKPSIASEVGAIDLNSLSRLASQLKEQGILASGEVFKYVTRRNTTVHTGSFELTLDGWAQYEKGRPGSQPSEFGLLVLKFNNPELDALMRDAVKPAIKKQLGFDLVDMRDVPKAGLIDSHMQERIRGAAFVIADLTHDNPGAYWEAGVAEGANKPVLYICEKSKFDADGTHFDTHHRTTVLWSTSNPDAFVSELIETLRRSLSQLETV